MHIADFEIGMPRANGIGRFRSRALGCQLTDRSCVRYESLVAVTLPNHAIQRAMQQVCPFASLRCLSD